MATVRKSLGGIRAARPRVDRAKLDSTTEQDIRRHQVEDDEDLNAVVAGLEPTVLPQVVRKKVRMTQEQFAAALRIPVATLRNWEQNRVKPDPAARALLMIVYKAPKVAFQALA